MSFERACERLLGNEGGYVDRPDDPGGETNWGITWPVLREAIAQQLVPADTTIAGLARDQAKAIYRARFWERGQMAALDPALAFQVFDFAVNSGIETALRKLQAALGVADDGHIGPVTLAAMKATPTAKLIMRFLAQRLRFWTKCKAWPANGAGWANRAATDLEYATQDF